jgi:hypothetical protein
MQDEAKPAVGTLVRLEVDGDGARAIAGRVLAEWQRVETALSPVIGRGGVAALFRRSLFLARAAHPWLPEDHAGALDPVEFTGLQAALALRPAADASAADKSLQRTFQELLASLIGDSLTERLLRPAPGLISNSDAEQDTTP